MASGLAIAVNPKRGQATVAAALAIAGVCCLSWAPGRAEAPAGVFGGLSDYTQMWWANGLRDERLVVNIQTSRAALSFDYTKFDLTHLMPLSSAPDAKKALVQPNGAIFGKPNASLACVLEADGKRFVAVAPRKADFRNNHLVESGRWFQRRHMEELTWTPAAPIAGSGLEVAAWPDRILLLLRTKPNVNIRRGALVITLGMKDAVVRKTGSGTAVVAASAGEDGGLVLLPSPTGAMGTWSDGAYAVRLPLRDRPAGKEIEVGLIVRPISGKPAEAARAVLQDEDSPCKVTARQIAPRDVELPVAYDRTLGWQAVGLRNDVADNTPEGKNRRIERVALTIANPDDRPRPVRLCFSKARTFGIEGVSAMLRDADGYPTGIPVQISKNWHSGRGPGRYQGPWCRGLTMLTVPARTTLKLEYTSVNALWGGAPAASHAQLCLTGWGSNQLWDESAVGAWGESICFEPDQGQRGGAVLDTRPLMVWSMGDRPRRKWGWTHNVGGADFLVYYDKPGQKQWNSRMRVLRRRHGPVLTEATYAGRSHDAKIDLQYTVSTYRTDDVTRGIYRFRYDVRKEVTFDRLVLFQAGGDGYSYTGERLFARGSAAGLAEEWKTTWGGNTYRTKPAEAAGPAAWFSMHGAVRRTDDEGAWANRGLVIRQWRARLGGKQARPWAAERGAKVRGAETSLIDILPPPAVRQLQPGDFVEATIEHVVVPQAAKDYYGPNANLAAALAGRADTWRMILREARGNDLKVDVSRGRLVRMRPTRIAADGDRAEFSIAGGLGYVPITISGLGGYRGPVLEMRQGEGPWRRVDQSDHGRDFWQTDYDAAGGAWDVTYSVPLDSPNDVPVRRDFRFRLAP